MPATASRPESLAVAPVPLIACRAALGAIQERRVTTRDEGFQPGKPRLREGMSCHVQQTVTEIRFPDRPDREPLPLPREDAAHARCGTSGRRLTSSRTPPH